MKSKEISEKEFKKIHEQLSAWANKVFADMWKYNGRMVFSTEYDTAALEVVGNKFRINANPRYWKRITKFQKIFLIVHELLHLSFGHWLTPDGIDRTWANIAQDIQVNEYIQANYPMLMLKFKGKANQAWMTTVFKHKAAQIEKDRDYLYYYDLLMQCLK